jgi:hypothetical protein
MKLIPNLRSSKNDNTYLNVGSKLCLAVGVKLDPLQSLFTEISKRNGPGGRIVWQRESRWSSEWVGT